MHGVDFKLGHSTTTDGNKNGLYPTPAPVGAEASVWSGSIRCYLSLL